MKRTELFFGLIRIPIDFLAAVLAAWLAYILRAQEDLIAFLQKPDLAIFPPLTEYLRFSSYEAFGLLIILGFLGMYSLRSTYSIPREIKKLFYGICIWAMAIITYYFFIRSFPFSRLVLGYTIILSMLFLTIGRLLIRTVETLLLTVGIGKRRVVLIGEGKITEQLRTYLEQSRRYSIQGIINSFANLPPFIDRYSIEEVIQTKDIPNTQASDILDFCREHHLQYHFVPSLLEVQLTNVEVSSIYGIPLISLKPTPLDGWGKVIKRTFDIVAATIGLIVLSPVFLIIAIAIKLDSSGSVFFRYLDDGRKAKRVGQFGKKFQCLKFRTMYKNTHSLRDAKELAAQNKRVGSPLIKIANDPRVTYVGKFLRKYSLDEMPQLWNVLVGEMSLVGPRPHLVEEVDRYQRHHKFVLTIKPGLTGLAQVNGRSDLQFEREVRLDTYYIEHWSLVLDIKILVKTIGVVLKGYQE